jgi:hypothetical protein
MAGAVELEGGLQLLIFRQDAPLISQPRALGGGALPRERFSPMTRSGHALKEAKDHAFCGPSNAW